MVELNMNILLDSPRAVIHCKSEDEALQLLRYLKENYPDKVSNWRRDRTDWSTYGRETIYHVYWDEPYRKMMYGSISGSIHGKIFEYEDLLCNLPELPIELSDMPLSSLFC